MSPQLDKEYVQTGKVRWVFRNFAFLTQDSLEAAAATYCAQEQGKFVPFEEKLFANQGAESATTFTKDNMAKWAGEVGMDTTAFSACISSGKYTTQVQKDNQYASQAGIRGTPSFFINGTAYGLQGQTPQDWLVNFRKALDAELAKN